MNKIKLALATIVLCLSQATLAAAPPQPAACPSVEALQNAGLFMAKEMEEGTNIYLAFQQNKYNTPNAWGFLIGMIQADSSSLALMLARKALVDLKALDQTPAYDDTHRVWTCSYTAGESYIGVAVTPLPGMQMARKLMQQRH